ncbi:hypothetical protein FCV25MIE_26717 [Fagus crenata]
MIGFSLKDLLPPRPTPAAETAVPKDNLPRKRKAVERGSSLQPEGGGKIQEIPRLSPLNGPSPPSQPRMLLLVNVLDPSVIPRDAVASSAAILPMSDGMGAKVYAGGSGLFIEDRYRSQVEELRKAIGLANRYSLAKKAAVEVDKRARVELQKRTEAEESLKIALDSNSAAEEKLKSLETRLVEAEESVFARGRREAELDIAC